MQLALFMCDVNPYGDKWRATALDFPGVEGFGTTSDQARESLARLVLAFYLPAREEGLFREELVYGKESDRDPTVVHAVR